MFQLPRKNTQHQQNDIIMQTLNNNKTLLIEIAESRYASEVLALIDDMDLISVQEEKPVKNRNINVKTHGL